MVWALAASLAVALVFTPLTTTLLRGTSVLPKEPRWITWLTKRYTRGLQWVLDNRTDALMGVIALTLFTWVLPFQAVGCEEEGGGDFGEWGEGVARGAAAGGAGGDAGDVGDVGDVDAARTLRFGSHRWFRV